jgi:tetratricopeptide (TPR) repeat protein
MRPKALLNGKILGVTAMLLLLSMSALWAQEKMPVTTSSEEARQLFIDGRKQNELNQYEKSAKLMKQAIEKDPSFAMAHLYLGRIEGWNTNKGQKHLEKAFEMTGQVSESEKHMILYFKALNEANEKLQKKHLQALLDLHPQNERIQYHTGSHYYRKEKYEKAISYFKKSAELNDSFSPPLNMLGYSYMFLNKNEKAGHYFQKYVDLSPDIANSNDSYAEFLLNQGRFDESIKYYKKALELDPNFIASYMGLGDNYFFKGEYDLAKKHYRKVYKKTTDVRDKFNSLELEASVDVHQNNIQEALNTMDEYIELAREKNMPYYSITGTGDKGFLLIASGKAREGMKYYKEAIDMIETADLNENIKENLALVGDLWKFYALTANEKFKKARKVRKECKSEIAEKGSSNHRNLYYGLSGINKVKRGRYKAAIKTLSKSWDMPITWYYKGLALEKSGKEKKADRWFRKVARHYDNSLTLSTVRDKALAELEQ